MHTVRCPYCRGAQGRCAATPAGRSVTECTSCGRVVEERQTLPHNLFLLRAIDTPLPLATPDLPFSDNNINCKYPPNANEGEGNLDDDEDPFLPTGFVTAFSAFSLEPSPLFARSSSSFSGHLAELERALLDPSAAASDAASSGGPMVSVDHLRAYLQIVDVSSLLDLDHDVVDHAFQLFRDCSSTTCLRNRSVEALATAALVQAIREAQEPRTLQEISSAANLPQKEIGKYIKILGEALKLSQPINSNSISVHMPRFCTLLQLNKSAQELAAHIGEVVINKCFCTRRNPISISAAAIYLACQLEDKRKTQAAICKVTGLTEVTLRKVCKELLENLYDLLPPNYTPAVPPEKAFPMTSIPTGRISASKSDVADPSSIAAQLEKEAAKHGKMPEVSELEHLMVGRGKDNESKIGSRGSAMPSFDVRASNPANFWQTQVRSGGHAPRGEGEKGDQGKSSHLDMQMQSSNSDLKTDLRSGGFQGASQVSGTSSAYSCRWPFPPRPTVPGASNPRPPQQRLDIPSDDTGKS